MNIYGEINDAVCDTRVNMNFFVCLFRGKRAPGEEDGRALRRPRGALAAAQKTIL